MEKKNLNWRDNIIPCDCKKWNTCKYAETIEWEYERRAICGYCLITGLSRGCDVEGCDKYVAKEKAEK